MQNKLCWKTVLCWLPFIAEGGKHARNLTEKQESGLKDIKTLMKNNHIVTKTDKSDRLCLLTEAEYV